ncbi:acetyltransferase [Microbacterium nanhaiense]|uniref:Acetyltransferase n=1 Tax=Microbacterium nanhaiense TaxID=1301026 RepID=A0ABQ2MY65_9MICO|nr:GNAT family N-acetyltransferase [Microbacterium nanhaiense]GGO60163.1 acetyltransferase [Microbacterium nanhaiense]
MTSPRAPRRSILETRRLWLRELHAGDLPALKRILQDDVTMAAYEGAFDDAAVDGWLARQLDRYRDDGFGLWAVELRDSGEVIGQAGLTWQNILGDRVLEVGYLFNRAFWHRGYATESASACVAHAFSQLAAPRVWAQVRDTNIASMNVAIRLGMTVRGRFVTSYRGIDMPHLAFAIDGTSDSPGSVMLRSQNPPFPRGRGADSAT